MPCNDYESTDERMSELVKKVTFLEAALCGFMTALVNPFGVIDYEKAGISKKALRAWWDEHQELDREREKARQEIRRRHQLRINALKKLTPAERTALGLPKARPGSEE